MKKLTLLFVVMLNISFFSCTVEDISDENDIQQIDPTNNGEVDTEEEEETGE